MNVTLKIPARLAREVIGGAHCGYWIGYYPHRVRSDASGLYIGRPYEGAATTGSPIPKARRFVGAHAIADALVAMLQSGNPKAAQCAARVLSHGDDGPDKDRVLQWAVYGSQPWG